MMRPEFRLDTNDSATVMWLENIALPDWFRNRRWFAGDRQAELPRLRFEEIGQTDDGLILGLVAQMFEPFATSPYLIAMIASNHDDLESDSDAIIAAVPEKLAGVGVVLTDAALTEKGRRAIFRLATGDSSVQWSFGTVRGRIFEQRQGNQIDHREWAGHSKSLAGVEQSNTSVVFGDAAILKLLRRPGEPGLPNPDVEIPLALSIMTAEPITPPVIGLIQAGDDSAGLILGTVCRYLPNAVTGWEMALSAAKAAVRMPSEFAELTDLDIRLGRDLAIRTAELHQALSRIPDNEAFAPVAVKPADLKRIGQELKSWSEDTIAALERRTAKLGSESIVAGIETIVRHKDAILKTFDRLDTGDRFDEDKPLFFMARHHGDYHLGQVLWTDELGWQAIDFEGEPNRDIEERRRKAIALRDIAGMVRSFDYAQAVALREMGAGPDEHSNATNWRDRVTDTFVHTYFAMVGDVEHEIYPLIPANYGLRQTILTAFLLEKNLYELVYELNHRPDWVEVPLNGLLEIVRAIE